MAGLLKLRVVPHHDGLGVAVRGRGGPDGGGEEVKGASAMRQPVDCGGSTPLWLRGREDLTQRQQRRPEGTESEADRPANDANEEKRWVRVSDSVLRATTPLVTLQPAEVLR